MTSTALTNLPLKMTLTTATSASQNSMFTSVWTGMMSKSHQTSRRIIVMPNKVMIIVFMNAKNVEKSLPALWNSTDMNLTINKLSSTAAMCLTATLDTAKSLS